MPIPAATTRIDCRIRLRIARSKMGKVLRYCAFTASGALASATDYDLCQECKSGRVVIRGGLSSVRKAGPRSSGPLAFRSVPCAPIRAPISRLQPTRADPSPRKTVWYPLGAAGSNPALSANIFKRIAASLSRLCPKTKGRAKVPRYLKRVAVCSQSFAARIRTASFHSLGYPIHLGSLQLFVSLKARSFNA